jgi:hypothetical protein
VHVPDHAKLEAPCLFLNPTEWAHWVRSGWFIKCDDGRVLSNSPHEPVGLECIMVRLIPC